MGVSGTRPRAVITGAGVRVGRAIALELASAGFDLALHYRSSRGPVEEVQGAAEALGAEVFLHQADLATPEGCDDLVKGVLEHWSGLELLVNNASAFDPVPFGQITVDQWEAMLGINLRAPFLLAQGLLEALRQGEPARTGAPEGQHGVVIHLCDIGADNPVSGYAHYSVSKAGLVMLVKAMAVELAPAVRTVGLSPGQVCWPDDYDEAKRERLSRRIPLGRVGTPADMATLARFVATEGHYLNGCILPVDGGLSKRY
jgi:pteridine reductase